MLKHIRLSLLYLTKKFGKELSDEAIKAISSLETVIHDNQALNREEKKRLQKEEGELRKGASTIPQDKMLMKAKQPGLFAIYRRLRKEGKEDPSKKISVFSAIKSAFLEVSLGQEADETDHYDRHPEDEYQKQCEIAEKIKKCDEDYKKLGEQLKVVGKEIASKVKEAMAKARVAYDDAIKSVTLPQITPVKVKAIIGRVTSFSRNENLVEWAKNLISKVEEPELQVEMPTVGMDR